jgi:cyanate permease
MRAWTYTPEMEGETNRPPGLWLIFIGYLPTLLGTIPAIMMMKKGKHARSAGIASARLLILIIILLTVGSILSGHLNFTSILYGIFLIGLLIAAIRYLNSAKIREYFGEPK